MTARTAGSANAVLTQALAGGLGGALASILMASQRRAAEQLGTGDGPDSAITVGITFGGIVVTALILSQELGSRSGLRLLFRDSIGALAGALLGVVGFYLASLFFGFLAGGAQAGPLEALARSLGWGLFGSCLGIAPGLVARADRRIVQGLLGGALGGVAGGCLFEVVSAVTPDGSASRFLGYTVLGLALGATTAAAEQALRAAWLTFLSGSQEGRTVLLFRDENTLGRDELADVPLFGDSSVQRRHACLSLKPLPIIRIGSPIAGLVVDGVSVRETALVDGSLIEIGTHRLRFYHREVAAMPPVPPAEPEPPPAVPTASAPARPRPRTPEENAAAYTPGMPLVLRVATGPASGRVVTLSQGLTVGREMDNDLTLLDPKVSRYHARIEPRDGAWVLSDLGSTNGTRLNGLRVVRCGLVPGDFIYVGDTVILVEEPSLAPPTDAHWEAVPRAVR